MDSAGAFGCSALAHHFRLRPLHLALPHSLQVMCTHHASDGITTTRVPLCVSLVCALSCGARMEWMKISVQNGFVHETELFVLSPTLNVRGCSTSRAALTGARAKAWCLLIRAEASYSLSLSHGGQGESLVPPYTIYTRKHLSNGGLPAGQGGSLVPPHTRGSVSRSLSLYQPCSCYRPKVKLL